MRKSFLLVVAGFVLLLASTVRAQTVLHIDVVSQRFERGEMIYNQYNGEIFVLANSGRWWHFSTGEYGVLPDNPVRNIPEGVLAPINGFGRIWAANRTIREALGWAVLPEIGFPTRMMISASDGTYIERLDELAYWLHHDQTWETLDALPQPDDSAIERFSVTPGTVQVNGTLHIEWETSGVDFVTLIFYAPGMQQYSNGRIPNVGYFENLPTSGNLAWQLPENFIGEEVFVRLGAIRYTDSGTWDERTSEGVSVTVTPARETVTTQAAYQRFENGFMIWREDTGAVRTFTDLGSWTRYEESEYTAWDATTNPRACTRLPVNAFGLVWREPLRLVSNRLGCPAAGEESYTLQVNFLDDGEVSYNLPDGHRIILNIGHVWRFAE